MPKEYNSCQSIFDLHYVRSIMDADTVITGRLGCCIRYILWGPQHLTNLLISFKHRLHLNER